MNKSTILLIDDDQTLLELLKDHFTASGWHVLSANSGNAGLEIAIAEQPDMLILDVMMPGMDGWQICERVREQSTVPIIMLTAKDQEMDKLRGFRLGVDDYVTKPFSFAELTARAGAVLSRVKRQFPSSGVIESGNLSIDFDQRRVSRDKEIVELTPTEYRLLSVLVRYSGRPVPTETLLDEVWGSEFAREAEHVKHYIWALRKKLENDPGSPKHILTERGFGYRFE